MGNNYCSEEKRKGGLVFLLNLNLDPPSLWYPSWLSPSLPVPSIGLAVLKPSSNKLIRFLNYEEKDVMKQVIDFLTSKF